MNRFSQTVSQSFAQTVKQTLLATAAAAALIASATLAPVPAAEAATDISYKASGDWYGAVHQIAVTTPAGQQVPLNVTVFAQGAENVEAIKQASVTSTVRPGTRKSSAVVEVAVLVPTGANGAVHLTGSVQSGDPNGPRIFAQRGKGLSGQVMTLTVNLD